MSDLSASQKKSIQKAVDDGTEDLTYGYDRIVKRGEIVHEQAEKYGVKPARIEEVLAEGRQAKPTILPTEPDVPITGPPPNPVPAPRPGPVEPDNNFDANSGTVEAPAQRIAPAKKEEPKKAPPAKAPAKKEEPAKKAPAPAAKKAPAKKTSGSRR